MRGIYTAGVIDALLDDNIKFDCVIGVSAGALFGINYVSNQRGRTLRYNLNYAGDKDYMGIYSLLTTGNVMNKEFCFDKLVNSLDPFDYDTFKKSNTKFYAVVTNLNTGEAEYKLINFEDNNSLEYLRASGSMPLLSKIVKIDDQLYLDGGVGDSIPVKKAFDMGYDKVIVVTTQVFDYVKEPYKMLPFNIVYKDYKDYKDFLFSLRNRHNVYNDTLEYLKVLESDGSILVIRPSRSVKISKLENDKEKILEQYNLGYDDTFVMTKKIRNYLK